MFDSADGDVASAFAKLERLNNRSGCRCGSAILKGIAASSNQAGILFVAIKAYGLEVVEMSCDNHVKYQNCLFSFGHLVGGNTAVRPAGWAPFS